MCLTDFFYFLQNLNRVNLKLCHLEFSEKNMFTDKGVYFILNGKCRYFTNSFGLIAALSVLLCQKM